VGRNWWLTCGVAAVGVLLIGTVAAQYPDDRPAFRSMFGDRRLGQPLRPGPSRFDSGIQRGPSGNFLGQGRPDGANMFATPWRRVEPGPLPVDGGFPPQPVTAAAPLPVIVAPPQPREASPTPPPEEPPAATPAPDIWFRSPRGPAAASPPEASNGAWLSPSLSTRIAQLAQAGGVPTSSDLQVCIQGSTAVVRGAVATPYQRSVVGNLLALEPGVWHVDNQVIVTSPGSAVARTTR
jgi:hypothetical protein